MPNAVRPVRELRPSISAKWWLRIRSDISLFGRAAFFRSLIAAPFASQKMPFVRPEAPLFVPAHEQSARRAEIGSSRAAGPRVAARSGLDPIEHGARLRRGRASSLPDHGSFRGRPAQCNAGSRNMAIRKAGAPHVPGAVTAAMRAAAEKAEPPSLVPAGTSFRPSAGRNRWPLRRVRAFPCNRSRGRLSRRRA